MATWTQDEFREFVGGFTSALRWADLEDSEADFAPEADERIADECAAFLWRAAVYLRIVKIDNRWALAGHNFYLTRQGHGTGFWDSPEVWGPYENLLTRIAESFGEIYPHVSDEVYGEAAKIYI